jgi:plastocyanin domain-containing protein
MNLVAINAGGVIVILLIVWWFWLSRPKARSETGVKPIDILVDNGVYTPSRIEVPVGRPIILRFIRKDASPCAEKVLFDDFDLAADLPVGEPTDVVIVPKEAGDYEFTCQMHMYRGHLIATAATRTS